MEEQKSSWSVSADMISANCSTIRNILCIKDYIFYGIKNTVLVYNYKEHKVLYCLNGHSGRVNGVALLDTTDGATALCTIDTDKTMIVWRTTDVESKEWTKQVYDNAHTAEINNVATTRINNTIYLATF